MKEPMHSLFSLQPVMYQDKPHAVMLPPADVRNSRLKLWELESNYLCPVIGTCLNHRELQQFARRWRFLARLDDEYGLHAEAVGWARTRNDISIALHKWLDRRYRKWLDHFTACKDAQAVQLAWQAALEQGEVAGAMWAAMTHKVSDAVLRHKVFGDVHMLSHQLGAGQSADLRELAALRQENRQLRSQQAESDAQHGQMTQRWHVERQRTGQLEQEAGRLHEMVQKMAARLREFETGQAMVAMGQRLLALSAANERLIEQAERFRQEQGVWHEEREMLQRVRQDNDALRAENQFLRRCVEEGEAERADCSANECAEQHCDDCLESRPCRSILYVGGRTSLVARYRVLAEQAGCILLYHDGGLEEALARLPELICSADAVVCPTDCVSHSAYYQVKAQCKRAGKPCLFIQNASISGFAAALAQLDLQ